MRDKVIEWLFNGEVGISSKTIAASVLRVDYKRGDIPYDRSDFNRCYKLVKFADIPMSELDVLAEKYPKWEPLVENWDKLIFAFENGLPFYELLEKIRKGDKS